MPPFNPGPTKTVEAVVKWFNTTKGFGFIAPTDGSPDVFLHAAALEQAVAAAVPSPTPYFELAMLLRESGGAPDRVIARKVVRHGFGPFLAGVGGHCCPPMRLIKDRHSAGVAIHCIQCTCFLAEVG